MVTSLGLSHETQTLLLTIYLFTLKQIYNGKWEWERTIFRFLLTVRDGILPSTDINGSNY